MLKTFFFNVYLLSLNLSFYLFLFILFWSIFLLFCDLRKKFISFILVIVLFSILGFLHDLDGVFIIFLIAEFTIFLVFLMSYTQLYNNFTFLTTKVNFSISFIVIFIFLINYKINNTFHFFHSYYNSLTYIVSGDFYILYYLLFDQLPLITFIIIFIISFFSLFFIIMYFSLKLVRSFQSSDSKNLYFLRKQVLLKQTTFSNKVYTFQN